MFQRALLSDSDVPVLAEAVLEIMERVGVYCQNDEMMDALEAWGASVDRERQEVRFPRHRVESFVSGLRAEYAGKEEPELRMRAPGRPGLGTQVAQFYLDDETGERRGGTREDLIRLTKFGAVLHPDRPVGHSLLLQDVPPLVEPLEAGMILAEYAPIPGPPFAWEARQVPYLVEMGHELGIDDWFSLGATCFSHPLRFDKEVADRFVLAAKLGHPIGLTGMQIAGATTPVTVAGFVAVSAAEYIATWIAGRAINPSVPLRGSIWAATLDMRGGDASYSAPDAMLRAFALNEFLRRWCGFAVQVGGGEYSSAKVPGLYAALEKAYKALLIAAYAGEHPGVGQGMVETGKSISLVQLLLDHEMTTALESLTQEIVVNDETIGMDAILAVGHGLESNYLTTEHTLRHYRDNTWMPPFTDRSGYQGQLTEEVALAKARARIQEMLAQYQKPERDPAVLERMRAVVERARKELL
ncbi:MAG: trimethylamine methyltransferase family protein [Anaerolineae bacterium]|jgi:trimethylamine--corrinoid protein Co-methyltransferase